jgi:multiple sugar transport system permease protein
MLARRFLIPVLVFLGLCLLFPVLLGVGLSFFDIESEFAGFPYSFAFSGFENYKKAFAEAGFWNSVMNSIIYTVGVTAGTLSLGLVAAMLVQKPFWGRGACRSVMLLSWIVPTYIVGILWGFMWQQDTGLVNRVLFDLLHIDSIGSWFGISASRIRWFDGENAAWAIALPAIWHFWPFAMAMFSAAFNAIPKEVYEASEMDGVGRLEQFLYITLPLLRPAILAMFIQNLILNAYSFNIVVMLFGSGTGYPSKTADLILPYVFRATFQQQSWNLGGGLALSTLLMAAMTAVLLFSYRKLQRGFEDG